jgi:hypothetical protein
MIPMRRPVWDPGKYPINIYQAGLFLKTGLSKCWRYGVWKDIAWRLSLFPGLAKCKGFPYFAADSDMLYKNIIYRRILQFVTKTTFTSFFRRHIVFLQNAAQRRGELDPARTKPLHKTNKESDYETVITLTVCDNGHARTGPT